MATNLCKVLKRSTLVIAMGVCFSGAVQAQSTSGTIFGTVSEASGTTVVVRNNTGFSRSITPDASGRYTIGSLPVGSYTVTVQRGDQAVATRQVTVLAGAGTDVSFGSAGTLDTVTVTGVAPSIDITATDTRTVITSEQLERLPLARSGEAIALLAPGAISGAGGYFGSLVSFGGAGVSENAYYLNGYFSGEPLSNLGGFTLPYGAIEQQETYTGGYSAKYGRSDGGVISQVGKRGSNDWTFGGQATFKPKKLRSDQIDRYYPNVSMPSEYEYQDATKPGTLYSRGAESTTWEHTYSAYVGGPLLRDRLFFFAAAEQSKTNSIFAPTAADTPRSEHRTETDPKLYAKIDWNISDNHMLGFTYFGKKYEREGSYYAYDFANATQGAKLSAIPTPRLEKNQYYIGQYTGYLTDTLTLNVTYGRSRYFNRQPPDTAGGLPFVTDITNQNPALNGGTPIAGKAGGWQGKDARDDTTGIRADLEWILGSHTLTFGIDNIKFEAHNEGTGQFTDYWSYHRTTGNVNATLGVGSPVSATNPNGYYARKLRFFTSTDMSVDQKAWYIEDRWQVAPNLLLSLGIRNDQFTNKNDAGATYMDAKNQWAPRLGFSWDVFGDTSMKVYGNAGRYFLAMPNNVAVRGASASTYTNEYFTYTGIDANGAPTGVTPVPRLDGQTPRPVSANGEYGAPIDVLAFAPSDLKNMYQDEFILGLEMAFADRWMVGAKLTRRDLKSSIDDVCDPYTFMDHNGLRNGRLIDGQYVAQASDGKYYKVAYCYMFNPGGTNTFSLAESDANGVVTGARRDFVMSSSDWRFPNPMKRVYNALDIYIERQFDGVWELRADYTLSQSKGNNEGQVKSEFGQTNISKTQDWDVAELMTYADGYLANDRRHQFKLRGSYKFAEDWMASGIYRATSGAPISCLGLFNPDGSVDENSSAADPVGYGPNYHTCFGQVAVPGSVRTPWLHTLDLALIWRPSFLDKKLAVGVQVFNALNSRKTQQVDVTSQTDPYTVSNTYMLPISIQSPRQVMLTASYDF